MKPNEKNSADNLWILTSYLTRFCQYSIIFSPFNRYRLD
ncbi:hypothetical protein M917_2197 [Psychrobacter aquaticus CMS 56]|uniref:Uncharacterized protein n=1 Tax=Psychrobacter aquaticus CMS 56 TaxID=1354303 RepID=U4T3X8_9GAMM|nr:hypothetical protein M917_2197 [Psychrobacter aquaticus CMS 56]